MLQSLLRRRAAKHRLKILRKIWHLVGLIFPISYFWLTKNQLITLVGVVLFIFLVIDYIRLKKKRINVWFFAKFHHFLKEEEKYKVMGTWAFLTSTILVVLFFSREIAIAALIYLSVGDVAACVIGSLYGKTKIFWHKTVEGSIAFLTASLISSAILVACGLELTTPVLISGALVATIIEALPLFLDDNFTISLVSGFAMHLINKL